MARDITKLRGEMAIAADAMERATENWRRETMREIARLRAALETAERERDEARAIADASCPEHIVLPWIAATTERGPTMPSVRDSLADLLGIDASALSRADVERGWEQSAREMIRLRAALETAERRLRQVDEYSDGLRNRPTDSVPRGLDICSERKHRKGADDGE